MNAPSEIVVGVVGPPWGIKGQFLLNPRGSEMEFVLSRSPLRFRAKDGARFERALEEWHVAGGRVVVAVAGCASPEDAAALRGAEVLMDVAEFPAAPEGSYYPHELAGLRAVRAGGSEIGVVERVVETAGADLLEVRAGERILLIPFVEAICRVDAPRGIVEITPPDGLLELDAP